MNTIWIIVIAAIVAVMIVLFLGYYLMKGISPESVNIFKSAQDDEFPDEQQQKF